MLFAVNDNHTLTHMASICRAQFGAILGQAVFFVLIMYLRAHSRNKKNCLPRLTPNYSHNISSAFAFFNKTPGKKQFCRASYQDSASELSGYG
jgi:hypothetical protein